MQFPNFFSIENPKAIKARDFGYLNAINYMAPADTGGVGNLCPHASAGCKALCLGWYSGRAEMGDGGNVRKSRVRKAQAFMKDRLGFMMEMHDSILRSLRKADRLALTLCVRLNGATDIAWEGVKITATPIVDLFPDVQFVDYTKNPKRAIAHAMGKFPANYHLTFSRSETNEADCKRVLAAGGNVAVVFEGEPEDFPKTYWGYPVVDGTAHDLRHLDPKNVIVGLCPKGRAAKKDQSGFVVRAAA